MSDEEYTEFYRNDGFKYDHAEGLAWVREVFIAPFALSPGTLLDAGCGDGFWSNLFQEEGFEVTGVDRIQGAIDIAREKYPVCHFEVADISDDLSKVGIPDFYDLVFCRGVTYFWREDLIADGSTTEVLKNLLTLGPCLLEAYRASVPFFKACQEAGKVRQISHTREYSQVMLLP